jgi:hypothetical protein
MGMICYEFSQKRLSPGSSRLSPFLTLISLMGMICYEFSQKRLSPGSSRLSPFLTLISLMRYDWG